MSGTFAEQVERIRSGTHAVVDLDAYHANIGTLRSIVGDDVALMAVVKADAYGHGAVECGRVAIEAGAALLGVARVQEAVYLRSSGIDGPIVVIGPPAIGEVTTALENDITLTVGSEQAVDALLKGAGERSARVHVKVDSGMNRYGFSPERVVEVVARLTEHSGVEVEGVFTHFSSADELDVGPTLRQLERFRLAVQVLEERSIRPRYVHAANSAGILTGHFEGTNLVRSGIATYGLSPSPEVPVDERFKPVMSIWSVITRRATLMCDDGVGYGLTYRAVADEQIAAVPIGYADGLPRRLRNQGWFVIEGKRAPIRGSVCMDQTVVSAPVDAREGDPVLVLGSGASGEMTFEAIAEMIGTVNYEVATRVMARVPRLYVRSGEPVAWEVVLTGERGQRPS